MSNKTKAKKFGIAFGSIFFIPAGKFGFKKKPTQKVFFDNNVRKALKKIDSISNLKINFPPVTIHDHDVPIQYDDYEKSFDKAPYIDGLEIEFGISIEEKYQKDFFEKHHGVPTSTGEVFFNVRISYNYYSPVLSIRSQNTDDPSGTIFLVREFLLSKFKEDKENNVSLAILGPTPLHADCFIKITSGKNLNITANHIPNLGYAKILINLQKSNDLNFDQVLSYLFYTTEYELDIYYLIARKEYELISTSEEIGSLLEKEFSIRNSFLKTWLLRFNEGFRIERLSQKILEIESKKIRDAHFIKTTFNNLYNDLEWAPIFKEITSGSIAEIGKTPTKQILDHLRLWEDRRRNRSLLWVTLISAVAGGIVGSILTSTDLQLTINRILGNLNSSSGSKNSSKILEYGSRKLTKKPSPLLIKNLTNKSQ